MLNSILLMLPISGVLLETGSISDTMVAKIVMVSIIATPEKSSVTSFRRILFQHQIFIQHLKQRFFESLQISSISLPHKEKQKTS